MKNIPESAEVVGRVLMMYLSAQNQAEIQLFLEKQGLSNLKENEWYSLNKVALLFQDIENNKKGLVNLVSWGIEIGKLTLPDEWPPILAFFQDISSVYNSFHRGEGIGDVQCDLAEKGHIRIKASSPYPDDLEYGIFYEQSKQLLPSGAMFAVAYDETITRRADGGDFTIYDITWE